MKTTLVIGASIKPDRYSNIAIKKLMKYNIPVFAIGNKNGQVEKVIIETGFPSTFPQIDTVSLYLNPSNQKEYYNYIIGLKPERIIFNPGTENNELEQLARNAGIKTMEACTLVLLATGQY